MKSRNPTLAVAVIRASTDTQFLTPEVQAAAIADWANRQNVAIAETVFELGVSGSTPFSEREGLVQALGLVEAHNAGILLFADRSRISRDLFTTALVAQKCKELGVLLRTADGASGDLLPSDPSQDLVVNILDAVAQFERTLISQRTRAALKAKKARGERVGAVPYGKRLAANGTDLEPNPAEQAVIAEAKRLRAEGYSQRDIAETLPRLGFPPRSGKRWHQTQVVRLLQR